MKSILFVLAFALLAAPSSFASSPAKPQSRLLRILQESESACQELLEGKLRQQESAFESYVPEKAGIPLALSTARFELRPLTMTEIDPIIGILTHPKVAEMSGDHLAPPQIAGIIRRGVQEASEAYHGLMINFGIWERIEGGGQRLIGMSQLAVTMPGVPLLHNIATPDQTWMEVSYHLHPDAWGKGVASEVTAATARLAFEAFGVSGLQAETEGNNSASGNVLTKLGMRLIEKRSFPTFNKGTVSSNHYAMTREEYEARTQKK